MALTPAQNINDPDVRGGASVEGFPPSPPLSVPDEDFQTFEVGDLQDAPGRISSLSIEIILLSWLIVLLRTRDDSIVRYEWAIYKSSTESGASEHDPIQFRMDEVVSDLSEKVNNALQSVKAKALKRHVGGVAGDSQPKSLILSTGTLTRTAKGADEEGHIHLQVQYDEKSLNIRRLWHSEKSLEFAAERYVQSLASSVRAIVSYPDSAIADCLKTTDWDLNAIWTWNHELPPTCDFCMHDVISKVAQRLGDKVAIDSWDGCLTYDEIEKYSTFIAHNLREDGVKLHDVVPICFEKSRWTIVAVLAVMKVGATIALMDPTLPLARLQNMAVQVGATAMISSRTQLGISKTILPDREILVIDAATFDNQPEVETIPLLPKVPSDALMYIIFTSGSTGTPKGVKISHSTYSSSAIPRAAAVGYTEDSRVLDFASYAFDVSIDSMLLTLSNGGCLCIPSDDERLNDVNGAMRRMRITYAGITPSMARILDEEVIASLHALGLGGEAVSTGDCNSYGRLTRIVIGYGPCECTIGCTINSSAATGRNYISIGPGNGACMWIVDPNDHETLMPVGAVGELLVEGPIVGQGYLNDPEKTAAAFIEDPKWLTSGHGQYPGRRGRLYKTGDLGKFDPDGSGGIVFSGRKDTQVKLRGQRVELGEVESQLRARLPPGATAIAEVLTTGNQSSLVAFVAPQSKQAHGNTAELQLWQPLPELEDRLSSISAELAEVLPKYMVPTVYIPINTIPVLISSKTDRKRLRQFGATIDLRKLEQRTAAAEESGELKAISEPHIDREWTETENRLRKIWGQTMKIDHNSIQVGDNFFVLGGDSVLAMKLVSACKAEGLSVSVADVFRSPTLTGMAQAAKSTTARQETEEIAPFSMLASNVDEARREAARVCSVDASAVEDIYPCTATQEGLFTFSLKSTELYIAQRTARIPAHTSLDDWKRAWGDVVSAHPILRSRIVQLSHEPGFQQVVLKQNIEWTHHTADLDAYLEQDRNQRMDLGQPLARYAIVEEAGGKSTFVWSIHHILYDGWSEPLILEKVENALEKRAVEIGRPIRDFVAHLRKINSEKQQDFWRQELAGAVGPQFPALPSRDYFPTPNGFAERDAFVKSERGFPFTMATVIRAAWALVSSQYTLSGDIVFGETLNGRDVDFAGVESVIGPLNATIPIRVKIDRKDTVQAYLQSIQAGMSARAAYQHMGFQYIRKASRDAQMACEAPTGIVINAEMEKNGPGTELGFQKLDILRENLHFNPYPLMLAFALRKDGFRVCASFDVDVLSVPHVQRVLAQIEQACQAILSGDLSRPVAVIDCLSSEELDAIWSRNSVAPLSLDSSAGRLAAASSLQAGSLYPPAAVQWVCDPRDSSLLTALGGIGELWLESNLLQGEFVQNPSWLVNGSRSYPGRIGRLQATGDLVKFNEDGNLIFIGRNDEGASAVASTEKIRNTAAAELTPAETVLRSAWAQLLGIDASEIHVDDNFFRMGGDSVMAMKLASILRAQGHSLTVAQIFKHMRLSDAAKVMTLGEAPKSENKASVYQPFSSLEHADADWLVNSVVRPRLADPSWKIKDICPVTDMQALDVRATVSRSRTSLQYTTLYFETSVDEDRLNHACEKLVETHDILRTVFVEKGAEILQVVIDDLELPITVVDSEQDISEAVKTFCEEDIEQDLHLGTPFLRLVLVHGKSGGQCLIVRLSHAQYDGESLPRLLNDLERLYTGTTIVEPEQISRYIAAILQPAAQEKASQYWQKLLAGSQLSILPGATAPPEDRALFRSRPVDLASKSADITTANILSAAWAVVLARRLRIHEVIFGAVSSGRIFDASIDLENVSGPCYQIMPIRVCFNSDWTALDLFKYIQSQTAESSSYDFLGFEKLSPWSEEQFFNSVVHHQDVIEEVDYMPFGDGQCRVDAIKPHGDAASPLKVVSYVRAGETFVGVVGSEKKETFVEEMLGELVGAVQELVGGSVGFIRLGP